MRRRDFIGLASGVALWGPRARAQQKVPIVGFLNPTSPEVWRVPLAAFHEGLRRAGYVDGPCRLDVFTGPIISLPLISATVVRTAASVSSR